MRVFIPHHYVVLLGGLSLTLSLFVPIVYCSQLVSWIHPVYVQSYSSNTCTSVWRGPWENVTYEFVHTSPTVSCMFCLPYLGDFWDDRLRAVQLQFSGHYFQDLFNIARSILVQFSSSFFSIRLVSVHVVHPCSSTDTTAAWKNCVLFYWIDLTSIGSITYR